MTDAVWKFPLPEAVNRVEMPAGAVVLHVDDQCESIALWARVDSAAGRVTRVFHVVGTGRSIPDAATTFRGTALTYGGSLVFHVFEEA